ncbi:MAG: hypothetical protein VB099_18345, partial [Candidatus Limiplasma sp.]|nr:hypothetical protein [Candidatus Limiplasma sp.]
MHSNAPGQPRPYEAPPVPSRRPVKDYTPKKRKSRAAAVLPLLLLFVALLAGMYAVFPKQAGRHVGSSMYDGLVISEVMAANSSA